MAKTKKTNTDLVAQAGWLYGWQRTAFLIALLLISIISQVDRILPFILAESVKTDLGLSDTQLGLVTGLAFSVCYSLASLPLARLADRGWAKQVLVGCIIIWCTMTTMGGLATGFVTLMLSRLGVALGEAGGAPASHAFIAQKVSPAFRGRAIGLFSMGIPLGTMVGFAAGGWANDNIGWRNALFVAGAVGLLAVIPVLFFSGKSRMPKYTGITEGFIRASRSLLAKPAFLWLFVAANLLGFASAPFYAFTPPFLIRTYGLTASQVGLSFGLLQGLMGIVGTLIGGRLFDRAINRGSGMLMAPPAIVFCIAAATTLLAYFMPFGWLSIAFLVPGMFSFAFLLPYAFGAGHLVAGPGSQALSTSLLMLGSGLLGSALSPLLVGLISDTATAAGAENGLRLGMVLTPIFILLSGFALFEVNKMLTAKNKIQ